MANVLVWLDSDNQVICQRIEGALEMTDLERLLVLTAEQVRRLNDPGDVRILVDARALEGSDPTVRKRGVRIFDEKNVKRMALWGGSALERAVQRLLMVIVGNHRVGIFRTEEEARRWLTADRRQTAKGPGSG